MALWEFACPRRVRVARRGPRWFANLGLSVVGALSVPWIFPLLAVGMAELASAQGWGLFNNFEIPEVWAMLLGIAALDAVVYFQHMLFHFVPLLWRLHKVHHSDRDLDVTSGIRFHPVEIWLSLCIKLAAIALIGASAKAVVFFEVILNGMALFNHANVGIPISIDRWLRCLVVTPDMHRVHHSVIRRETDSNFGFNLSCWDRVFGTYRAQPAKGHEEMNIGLNDYPDASRQNILWLLALPFMRQGPRAGGPGETL